MGRRETCRRSRERHGSQSQTPDFLQRPKIRGLGTHPASTPRGRYGRRSRMSVNGRSKEREMTNRVGIFVGLAVWLLVLPAGAYAAPAYAEDTEAAGGTGTTLYEISERVTFDPMSVDGHFVIFRNRSEEHTSELQSPCNLVCRLLLEKKKQYIK